MLTYILIGIITLLIICYFGYRYIIRLTGLSVNILFIIGSVGALSVIVAPEYYQTEVDKFLLEQSLYNDLVDLEKSVLKIQDFEDYIPFDFDIPFEGGLSTGIAETLSLLLTTIIFVLSVTQSGCLCCAILVGY